MHPVRGFLFAFTAGLALLFSGHGIVSAALSAEATDQPAADLGRLSAPLTVA